MFLLICHVVFLRGLACRVGDSVLLTLVGAGLTWRFLQSPPGVVLSHVYIGKTPGRTREGKWREVEIFRSSLTLSKHGGPRASH